MRLLLLIIVFVGLFLSSCDKNKTAEPAFFIRAGKISVNANIDQGTASHKITDLWLYVNNQFQGSYPVGNLMPIVSKGEPVQISIFAGIRNNGIADTRIFWQFYSLLEIDTLVESGKIIERDFTFNYSPFAIFPWIENFEGGTSGLSVQKSPISSVNYRITSPDQAFEGNSIELALSGDSIIGQIESTNAFELPSGSSNVYLELNYKGNEDFMVGLLGDNAVEKSALMVKAQDNWNKIYVQLSYAISAEPVSNKYKVFFRVLKREIQNPKIFLDNIKLVYIP